ncbi:thaumatin-like protein 1b [Rhododendron vialii]|uniref:thaumatin-like protein 1b n=1 Tax=Rhododendron vialii TaxID=182163 RepID=UPI00265F1F49|nr:thaumatin-like protein 1b [Rhododendron vialii]
MAMGALFNLALATLFVSGVHSAIFTIKNHCPYTIWPGVLTGQGSPASSTGFELRSQASSTVNIPAPWSGRVWARFVCANAGGRFSCRSADCGTGQVACRGAGAIPPATLVEFTIAAGGGRDFYDVSLVDGFNLPVSVVPQGRLGCRSTNCPVDINAQCPGELSIKNTDGGTIGCKSACLEFKQPQFCCTGAFSSPNTCKPTGYSRFFKNRCPNAYSYAFDDRSSTFTCGAGTNYLITFCP